METRHQALAGAYGEVVRLLREHPEHFDADALELLGKMSNIVLRSARRGQNGRELIEFAAKCMLPLVWARSTWSTKRMISRAVFAWRREIARQERLEEEGPSTVQERVIARFNEDAKARIAAMMPGETIAIDAHVLETGAVHRFELTRPVKAEGE